MATMSIRELFVSLVVRDRASKAVRATNKQMDRAKNVMRKATRETKRMREEQGRLKKSTQGLGSAWKTFAGVAGVGFVLNQFRKLGTEAVTLAIDFEQTEISFETLLGSAKRGRKVLQDLEDFSLATPFEPDPIIRAGKALLAVERPLEGLIDDLKRVGDIAAISGVPIQDLTNIFAKVFSKGKAQTEELLQVAERGIPILSTLARVMGVDTTEQILEMGSKGEITFEKFNEAFKMMTGSGGAFEDGMTRLAKTTGGVLSTLAGFEKIVKRTLGKEALVPLKELSLEMIELAKQTLAWLRVKENVEGLKQTLADVAEVLKLILRVTAAISKAMAALAQFKRTGAGQFFEGIGGVPMPGGIVRTLAGISRQFGGARADGGPVNAGKSFLVGERGPEMFTPGTSGMITPGGGGVTIKVGQVVVHANDAAGGRRASQAFMDALNDLAPQIRLEAGLQWDR